MFVLCKVVLFHCKVNFGFKIAISVYRLFHKILCFPLLQNVGKSNKIFGLENLIFLIIIKLRHNTPHNDT